MGRVLMDPLSNLVFCLDEKFGNGLLMCRLYIFGDAFWVMLLTNYCSCRSLIFFFLWRACNNYIWTAGHSCLQ